MSQTNLISTGQFVKQLPNLLFSLPSLIKGIRMATSTDLTKSVGLAMCFEEAVGKNPAGPAVISEGRSISYRDMDNWANHGLDVRRGIAISNGMNAQVCNHVIKV